jgi:serine/threonine protein kinase/phosphoribosyl 1,2-cyclic phosphodiesterase/anti-anti-sigma regulatory factor
MKIKIWGARGSLPVPLTSQEIETKICQAIYQMPSVDTGDQASVEAYVRSLPPLIRGTAGGNTTCVEIQAGDTTIIVDAGTGLYRLGLDLMKGPCGKGQGILHFVFSHPHWDHIQGFPMFVPAFIPGNRFFFHSIHDLETALRDQQRFQYFPVTLLPEPGFPYHHHATMTFLCHEVGEPFHIGRVDITSSLNHHPGNAYAYRFEDAHSVLVFASDAEYKDLEGDAAQERIQFFRNADAVFFDAQYGLRDSWERKVDFGHSSALIGVYLAQQARVKRLLLTHHDPNDTDQKLLETLQRAEAYQVQTPQTPCEIMLAYEGLELDLAPTGKVAVTSSGAWKTPVLTASATFDQGGVAILRQHVTETPISEVLAGSVVDLSLVEQLTPAGLKALVKLSADRPSEPIVLAGASPKVQETIRLAGYQDCFASYPSVEEALQAIAARRALELPGQTIQGHYQIEEMLRRGRLGTVLKAWDSQSEGYVALKLLSPALSAETLQRLGVQFERVRLLHHQHMVELLDWGREGDRYFTVEKWITGITLAEWWAQGKQLTAETVETLVIDLLKALDYAHQHGAIHGHVKPENIFLTIDGIQLGGFGLARLEEGRNALLNPTTSLQAEYLASEQALGQPIDARTDLYALGVVLYRLFTGWLPLEEEQPAIWQAHLEITPLISPVRTPQLTPAVAHFIQKLMAKNPNDRYPSARHALQVAESLLFGVGEKEQASRQQLVGRETQLAILHGKWLRAQRGSGNLVLLCGEAGVGKSNLALEAAKRSKAAVVLLGRSQAGQGYPTFHPFRQALGAYFASVPPELTDQTLYPLFANFASLVPEIRRQVPDLPKAPELETGPARLRLLINMISFIQIATASRPWILILDDLQEADEGSLELLRFLGRQLGTMALLVIGIYRDTELAEGHPWQAVLRELNHTPGYQLLQLDRLEEMAVSELLTQKWDASVPQNLVTQIYQYTEGNPLFVKEIARGLEESGLVYAQEPGWIYPEAVDLQLPQSIAEAVEGRVHYLNAESRDVLSQAAVLGETFRFDDLVALSGLSEWSVLDHLDLALARQLVQELPGGESLRFRHGEIHHVIYEELGDLRRRRLHHRAGETLEKRALQNPEQRANELAHHFYEAGEWKKALHYSLQAGGQAIRHYANAEAIAWYQRALELLDRLDRAKISVEIPIRLSVYESLGQALTLDGRYAEATEYFAFWRGMDPDLEVGSKFASDSLPQPAKNTVSLAAFSENN